MLHISKTGNISEVNLIVLKIQPFKSLENVLLPKPWIKHDILSEFLLEIQLYTGNLVLALVHCGFLQIGSQEPIWIK